MVSPFICGTFHPEEDRDELGAGAGSTSPSSTPRRSSARRHGFCRTHNNSHHPSKNPYSSRGLEKFEALLADLEEKKKKIYTDHDPDNISLVRFAYTGSNDCVPVVVKLRDKNGQSRSPPRPEEASKDKHVTHQITQQSTAVKRVDSEPKAENDKKGLSRRPPSLDRWRQPSWYMPVAVILILVFLVFFGRSVAILCTSIGWYMVPAIRGGSSVGEKTASSEKKKELARRSSENKITVARRSPDRSPRQHGQRRSW